MSLDVGAVLREGAQRTATRTGVLLMLAFVVVGLVSQVAQQSYLAGAMATGLMPAGYEQLLPPDPTPLAVDVSLGAALGLWFATAWAMEIVRVLGVRVMAADPGTRLQWTRLTRRFGWAVVNGFVGTLVAKVLVGVGLVLVVPGVFLAVSLMLVRQVVALEDASFATALSRSWSLASGNRWQLLLLAVVYAVGWLAVQFVGAVLQAALGGVPALGVTLVVGASAPLLVFGVAVGTRAYVHLSGDEVADTPDADGEEEWPDPPGVDL